MMMTQAVSRTALDKGKVGGAVIVNLERPGFSLSYIPVPVQINMKSIK